MCRLVCDWPPGVVRGYDGVDRAGLDSLVAVVLPGGVVRPSVAPVPQPANTSTTTGPRQARANRLPVLADLPVMLVETEGSVAQLFACAAAAASNSFASSAPKVSSSRSGE